MKIPHSKPTIDQEDIDEVREVLASGMIAQGEKVKEFEEAFARFIGTKYAVACSSGTSALHIALLSLEIRNEDEVILPSYVCSSPYLACVHAGAIPRIADVDPLDCNISAEGVKKVKSSKSRAVIVPHMFGMPAEIGEIEEEGIRIIEDCAQSVGAEYGGMKVGAFGAVSVFSFYATKMMTTGEGGMLVTDDKEISARSKEFRDYDMRPLSPPKYNYKMTDFQAALGISQLKKLDSFIDRRRELAAFYMDRLSEFEISLPPTFPNRRSVFYRYVIMVDDPDRLRRIALKKGITCERPVFLPLHRSLPSYRCPISEEVYTRALSIPLYPRLSDDETEHVVDTISSALQSGRG